MAEWPSLAHLALKLGVRVTYGRIAFVVTFVPRGKSGTLRCFQVIRPMDPISAMGLDTIGDTVTLFVLAVGETWRWLKDAVVGVRVFD